MAEIIGSLTVTLEAPGASASIASVVAALEAGDGLAERLCERGFRSLILCEDFGGLFRCETVISPAAGAGELHGFRVMPHKRYLEFVSAIVADGNAHVSDNSHGWPILSLGGGTSSVADAGGETTVPGKGDISISEAIA